MAIFISHITEEAPVALTLKGWIESTLLGKVKVFVSSDSEDIPPGDQWLDKISEALDESQVMIILCSPSAINRPWINFEAGCAWIRKIPIINLCHSGADKGDLPEPLSRFQKLNIQEDDFGQKLIKAINKHLGLEIKEFPRIDNEAFKKDLSNALKKISPISAQVEPTKGKIDTTMSRLEEIEIDILKILASEDGAKRSLMPSGFDAEDLARVFKISVSKMLYFLDGLADEKYVFKRLGRGNTKYALAPRGRKFLVENDLV